MHYQTLTRDEHFQSPGPKRILALDGGGLRGIATLAYLKRIETLLSERHGGDNGFRLCHYFDLIAGTSTGAIIAAGLATGMTVDELIAHYIKLGKKVFQPSFWRKGLLRDRYDEKTLVKELKSVFGTYTLGDPKLTTGLLIVTKRMDTGSPWPLGNNPKAKFFRPENAPNTIPNADYPLWSVVRASTAAPTFFAPEHLTIAKSAGKKTVNGEFVDGGISPFNNPALQALMYATLDGYKVGWKTGESNLLIVSIGTGVGDPSRPSSKVAAKSGINALQSLMDDCGTLVETLMQWLSDGNNPRVIDQEIGDLRQDLLAGTPSFSYQRYQLDLTREGVDALKPGISDKKLAALAEMDKPENMELLKELGERSADMLVHAEQFPPAFDLPKPADGSLQTYQRRAGSTVIAIPIELKASPTEDQGSKLFNYHKWDDNQSCKSGDWLVHNGDDVYTVDRETFEKTYSKVSPGVYKKTAKVWAKRAEKAGKIKTKEGATAYSAGDYLVYNEADGKDGYAVSAGKFAELYEQDG